MPLTAAVHYTFSCLGELFLSVRLMLGLRALDRNRLLGPVRSYVLCFE